MADDPHRAPAPARRCALRLAVAAADRLRVPRRRQPAAARRPGQRRRRLPGDDRVPRRPRPRAAVGRQGRRRHGRQRPDDRASTASPPASSVSVNGDVVLPANSAASLRQTSLLGEKFVSFDPPPDSEASGRLRGGETIGLDRTTRSAEIEEVLSALSLVLNGGSLEQLQVDQPRAGRRARGPRGQRSRTSCSQLDTFVGGLDAQKAQIVRALDSLDRLTSARRASAQTIATALDDIPAGVAVLTDAARATSPQVLTAPGPARRRRQRVIRAIAGQHGRRPAGAAADPDQLGEAGQALPRRPRAADDLPVPADRDRGHQGRLRQPVRHRSTPTCTQIAQSEGIPLPDDLLPIGGARPGRRRPTRRHPRCPDAPGAVDPPATHPLRPSPSPSATPGGRLPGLPLDGSSPLLGRSARAVCSACCSEA